MNKRLKKKNSNTLPFLTFSPLLIIFVQSLQVSDLIDVFEYFRPIFIQINVTKTLVVFVSPLQLQFLDEKNQREQQLPVLTLFSFHISKG